LASETVANLLDLLKEVWTQDRLEKQFFDGTRWFDKIEKTNKYTIGRQAQVPLETSLPGGSSTFLAAGGTLNAADDLHVDRADYTLSYLYQQVDLQVASLNQADSVGARSTVDAMDQTIQSNVLALRKDALRQAVSNGDALIAQCDTTSTTSTVELLATGYGYDAIVRGWLRPGMTVDIGTTANETAVASDRTITSVSESSTDPDIVISGADVATTNSHYISVANARSGATSNEINGLRTIAGSSSTAIGGLDPDTAAENFWKPAHVDTSTTVVSQDLLLTLQRKVYQKTGKWPSYITTSPKQAADLYALYNSQVRFASDSPNAGNVDAFKWNGLEINADPDIPDRELYLLTLEDFLLVTGGKLSKPTWFSDIEGAGGRLRWVQGTTRLSDALAYSANIAIKRRNSHAAAIGLTG
jgi:hypothetical protein